MSARWVEGNHVSLLENGEEFFPRVSQAIRSARHHIFFETFILRDDKVGRALQADLIDAANRQVRVEVTVDAWGSLELPAEFIEAMTSAGVCFHLFDAEPRWLLKFFWFRRLHRKLIVIDGVRAFIGGINFSADHLADFGPEAKQDYAVEVLGPIVSQMHAFAVEAVASVHRMPGNARRSALDVLHTPRNPVRAGKMESRFVSRDNVRRKNAIERQYRAAIRTARRRVIIANAYFFPGYRLIREIRNAARRGVDVRLIMQGQPDMRIVKVCASMLYQYLLRAGVRIFEYCDRPFHGKVALVDDEWSTVGSSNLDPLSLSLNLEANLFIRDGSFNERLHESLNRLMKRSCKEIDDDTAQRRVFWRPLVTSLAFHVMRHFPRWAGWMPKHSPRLTPVPPPSSSPALDSSSSALRSEQAR